MEDMMVIMGIQILRIAVFQYLILQLIYYIIIKKKNILYTNDLILELE